MLTRIDHVMICVPELSAGIEAYRRIGFDIYPGGEHAGRGTHNAIAFHGEVLQVQGYRGDPFFEQGTMRTVFPQCTAQQWWSS